MRRIEDVAPSDLRSESGNLSSWGDRALHGHQQPVYSYGKLVGTRTVYNDRLLMFMLRNRAPERFGGALSKAGGAAAANAIDKRELARLKQRWRREWEAEHAAGGAKRSAEIIALIDAKLGKMHENWLKDMSPHVRALYRAYEQAAMEEAAHGPPKGLPLLPGVAWPEREPGEMDEAVEDPAPPPGRVIALKDDGWSEPQRGVPDDWRAQSWP